MASIADIRLTEAELDAAMRFVRETRYSYSLPVPFELEAVHHCWDSVRPVLARINLLSHPPRKPLTLMAPKQRYAIRPVQLLDPLDLLLLSGLVLRIAEVIEAHRPRADRDIVHSFRIQRAADGSLHFVSNWTRWAETVNANVSSFPFVGRTDIADFFPQVYLHRLENSLTAVTASGGEVQALTRMLEGCAHGTSYGIPVGPVACNILAEALLIEVDEYLISSGVRFARYVDDYLIFGRSEAECLRGLHLLAERLYATQGLVLNVAKTRIQTADAMIAALAPPADPNSALQRKITREVFGDDKYTIVEPDRLTPEQLSLLGEVPFERILATALEQDLVDLNSVRFVLSVMSGMKKAVHIGVVLSNLNRLQGASEAVARFLMHAPIDKEEERREVGKKVLEFLRGREFVPDFQAVWLLEPFVQSAAWGGVTELRMLAREHPNRLVRRQATLALGQAGNRSALLDVKSRVDDVKDWELRAILFACRALPRDERDAFWKHQGAVGGQWTIENAVAKATVEYAKNVA